MTTFDWAAAAKGEQAAKMEEGWRYVTCTKVINAKKDGIAFKSRDGSPQVMSVWEDQDGGEAVVMFTLSKKAAWVLARCLGCCGADLQRMAEEGVSYSQFDDIEFAKKQLIDRKGWAMCKHNGAYANLDFHDQGEVPVDKVKAAMSGAVSEQASGDSMGKDEDIPF